MTPRELFAKELSTYDREFGKNSNFYYTRPYERDFDSCNWSPLREYSGNVIKYYQYKLDKPVVLFTDPENMSY